MGLATVLLTSIKNVFTSCFDNSDSVEICSLTPNCQCSSCVLKRVLEFERNVIENKVVIKPPNFHSMEQTENKILSWPKEKLKHQQKLSEENLETYIPQLNRNKSINSLGNQVKFVVQSVSRESRDSYHSTTSLILLSRRPSFQTYVNQGHPSKVSPDNS